MKDRTEMRSTGIRIGLIFGVTLLTLSYLSLFFGIGTPIVVLLGSLYAGYAATFMGGILGLIWGFVHGFVVGALVALIKDCIKKL